MNRKILKNRINIKILFMFFIALSALGQNKAAERFIHELENIKSDSLQTDAVITYLDLEQSESGVYTSGALYSNKIIAIGKKVKNEDVEAVGQILLGYYYFLNQNQPQAMEHFIKAMKLGEKQNNKRTMLRLYYFMGFYDIENRIKNLEKVAKLAKETKEINWQILVATELADEYFAKKQYDLALEQYQRAYEMDLQLVKNGKTRYDSDVYIQVGLGHTYLKLNVPTLALTYFRLGLKNVCDKNKDDELEIAYQGLATYFKENHNTDSTFYYSSKFYKIAEKGSSFAMKRNASNLLYGIYKERGDTGNALKYHEIFKTANDSITSIEKTKKLEGLINQENERQKELADKRDLEKATHKINLEYSAIALGLVCFFIIFLLLSQTIIVKQKLINFLGTMALLIIFEFLNLLLHPYLGELTHHSPTYMLITMVSIAAILVPLHHKIEHWTVNKLVEKNKRIRLAAAKKTIEELNAEV